MKWPDWTGVGERTYKQSAGEVVQPSKTVWDWLQLLIVPAVLAGAVTIYNQAQTDQANNRQAEQAAQNLKQAAVANQDTIFQSYLSQMSSLMVNKKLLTSKPNTAASKVGRALTVGFLSAMDGPRKGDVVQFLFHAHLLGNANEYATGSAPGSPLINLGLADLRGANLTAANIPGANLTGADLTDADLTDAYLLNTDFNGAILEHANLSHAIADANLTGANLTGADLTGASLLDANLTNAHLNGAHLQGAYLNNAILTGAILTGANLTGANLRGAIFKQTTCPSGHVTNTHC